MFINFWYVVQGLLCLVEILSIILRMEFFGGQTTHLDSWTSCIPSVRKEFRLRKVLKRNEDLLEKDLQKDLFIS